MITVLIISAKAHDLQVLASTLIAKMHQSEPKEGEAGHVIG